MNFVISVGYGGWRGSSLGYPPAGTRPAEGGPLSHKCEIPSGEYDGADRTTDNLTAAFAAAAVMAERGPQPLIEEALNLACHGARAQDQNFNVALERDLDPP